MPTRTIKTVDHTEHSGDRSAFTDYDNYVEYKNRLTQTKIYNNMIIFDSVTTTVDEIAVKIVWFIILFILIVASIFISIEGKENFGVKFISNSAASPSPSTSSENTSSDQTEKSEPLDNGSKVMPNQEENEEVVDSTLDIMPPKKPEVPTKEENKPAVNSREDSLSSEKIEQVDTPSNKVGNQLGLKSIKGTLPHKPLEKRGDLIVLKPSNHTLFEREIESLLDQAFIDPFTHYIVQYQEDKDRIGYVQQAKVERAKRCAKIEQNFQRRPKTCKNLAWLKRGYNYSCPQIIINFAQNMVCHS